MRTTTILLFFLLFGIELSAQNISIVRASAPKDITVIDYFTVNCIEKSWNINWKALSEIDSCKYVLQYSPDQVNWIEFKEIEGMAHTTGTYSYSTFMKRNSDTLYYFRLQYDCTSSVVMYKSPVMNICPDYVPDETPQTTFIVEYNNMDGAIQVANNCNSNSKSTVMVYSSTGQLLYKNEIMLNSSVGRVNIQLSPKSREILIVKISSGVNSLTQKILIP